MEIHRRGSFSTSPAYGYVHGISNLALALCVQLRRWNGKVKDLVEGIKMKLKLLALLVLTGSSLFAGPRVFVGVGVGGGWGYYPPAPPAYAYAPAYNAAPPYVGAAWIPGYYYPVGPRYYWREGYYARRPFVGAYWNAPRYYGGHYYAGRWGRR